MNEPQASNQGPASWPMRKVMQHVRHPNQGGLTLVELLIVLFIVGLGWFTLLPRLDPTDTTRTNSPLNEMNAFLDQVRHEAFITGRFQEVRIDSRHGRLYWKDQSYAMHSSVFRCSLNASPCPQPLGRVRIYPQGYMDRLTLDFVAGERWISADLDVALVARDSP